MRAPRCFGDRYRHPPVYAQRIENHGFVMRWRCPVCGKIHGRYNLRPFIR